MQSNYNNQKIDIEWLNSNLPMQNMVDNNLGVNVISPVGVAASDNMNGNNYDTSRVGVEYDLSGGASTSNQGLNFFKLTPLTTLSVILSYLITLHYYSLDEQEYRRRRRNVNVKPSRFFNRYTQSVVEQVGKSRSRRSMTFKNDNTLTGIAVNRATIFDCYDDSEAICVDAKVLVNNFQSGNKAFQLNIKFDLDLGVFRKFQRKF